MSQLITSLPNAPTLRSTDWLIVVVPNVITVSAAADATIAGTLYTLASANGNYELAGDGKYYNTGAGAWSLIKTLLNNVTTYFLQHSTYGRIWTASALDGTWARTSDWPAEVTAVTVTSATGLYEQTCKATLADIISAGGAITPDP